MKRLSFLKLLTIVLAILCTLLGAIVLSGWYTMNPKLIQVMPMFVPMQYNTALGFLLGGSGLLILALKDKAALAKIVFGLAGVIGLLTLLEYLFDIDLGIDQLLMNHYITVETSHPGRMAPNTALCFLLSSIAVMFSMNTEVKKIQFAGVLGVVTFGLGLVAFIGYLIGMEVTYGWGKWTKMAVHTAIGFMVMGAGITTLSLNKERYHNSSNDIANNVWLTGYAFALALIIFFIDLSLPLGVAIGIPYILFILFGWFIKQEGMATVLAICATVFIIAGYLYSVNGSANWIVIANRVFALLAVWLVAGLLHQIKKTESALKITNLELDQQVVQVSNKNKELAQFTYIASHDLQEPLRTVTNFTRLFDEHYKEQLDERAHSYLHFISQASNRMSDLIKGLLDYARIGQNKQRSYVNLNKILEGLKIDLHTTIDETETTLQIGRLPLVRGFKVELGLLFQNLILNAIKFRRPKAKPEIKISAQEKANYYEFSIQDNGIGIAPEHQEKIFSIFQRLHSKKEYEGTGIGLAHCQKIVELHQGTIRVSSIPEQGSKFIFTIKKS